MRRCASITIAASASLLRARPLCGAHHDRFGRIVLVEVNPYTGAFIGEFRIL